MVRRDDVAARAVASRRARSPRHTPMYDPTSRLVYVAHGTDARTTVVHGRVLMRNRAMTTLDEAAIVAEALEWAEKVRAVVQVEAGD
jgi:cytosine/adenosine deaminase-related metal-dependent hydrolase